jgi:hypothetical protein
VGMPIRDRDCFGGWEGVTDTEQTPMSLGTISTGVLTDRTTWWGFPRLVSSAAGREHDQTCHPSAISRSSSSSRSRRTCWMTRIDALTFRVQAQEYCVLRTLKPDRMRCGPRRMEELQDKLPPLATKW